MKLVCSLWLLLGVALSAKVRPSEVALATEGRATLKFNTTRSYDESLGELNHSGFGANTSFAANPVRPKEVLLATEDRNFLVLNATSDFAVDTESRGQMTSSRRRCRGGEVRRHGHCESILVGATVALHQHNHNRYVNMWGSDMVWTGHRSKDHGVPRSWTSTFFRVHRKSHGLIGLHNPRENRWIRMRNNRDMDGAPWFRSWETFKAVDGGGGKVAFHCRAHNRFMRMPNRHHMDVSGHRNWWQLPHNWGWERFRPISALLRPNSIVALWNQPHHRFMRMHAHGRMDGSARRHLHHYPYGWTWELFRVVDAGYGQVALHNAVSNRFVKMGGDMERSPHRNWWQLPGGWSAERFTVVDAGHGRVALHNPWHNRFVSMCHHGDGCKSPHRDPDHLPGSWTWQMFHVLEVPPCNRGGGHHCKTCQYPQNMKVHHHCASCNPGYYMHGYHCRAFGCTGGRDRICSSCVAQHHRRHHDHCATCDAGHILRGHRCQSMMLGATVALHQANHNRFVQMWGSDLVWTGHRNWNSLPKTWTSTFFRVHFAGDAKVGLHNPRFNKWIRLRNNNDMDGAPWRRSWETFTAVNAGAGQVALHNRPHNKYMRMPNRHHMDTSGHRNAWDLPHNWGWERFRPISALLRPNTIVALWNEPHHRFMRMNGHHNRMDAAHRQHLNHLPAHWNWERFRVVEAGFGQIALHNAASNRFVKMGGDMERSPHRNWNQLPGGWSAERFTVVDAGHGRVALHNPWHNRFVSMCHHGDGCKSPGRAPDHLPGGWTWQMFHVVEIVPCATGGGGHCKTCQSPSKRKVHNHCASCNPGYYMHGHHCRAFGCTGGRDRICHACVAQHHRRHHDHCGTCDGGHVLRGHRCQSIMLGATIGLHQRHHNRFVNMWGSDLVWTGHRNYDHLPATWTSTFFRVHFAGDAKIGLHNPRENRWIRLRNNNDMDGAPWRRSWETFTAVHGGAYEVAFHNRAHNKYMRMPNRHHMDTSSHRNAWDLPGNWGWERFRPMSALLRPHTIVALWNQVHNRFMRMNAHHDRIDAAGTKHLHHLPANWNWELFRVVDAGFGQIALHSAASNRFVKMSHDMHRSPHRNWNQLPGGWGAERFTVIDAGHGRIALHNPWHNRFVSMCHHGDGCISPGKAPDHLPGGWTWQMFHVLEVRPCATGGGGNCKTCQNPWNRKVNNHCASCNPGYYMHGHHCKAYGCTGGRNRICGSCVAQHHRRHHEHCGSCNAGHVLRGHRCQSVMLGATLAFHQANHNRFVHMWGHDMEWTPHKNWDHLPTGWTSTFFRVHFAGDAKIGLHNPRENKWIRLRNNRDMDGAPWRRSWETFTAVDAGGGKVALHCAAHNEYMRMPNKKDMDTSGKRNAWDLPSNWGWERFRPVSVFLRPGKIVALWNEAHGHFMRMNGHHDKMDSAGKKHLHHLPSNWNWELFRVVDAGYGQIALHNAASNRFIKMGSDMIRSPTKNWNELPGGWSAERFTVIDAGSNRIALHHAGHNRFVSMCHHGDGCLSPHKAPDALPSGWTWQMFHWLEVKPCHTGGRAHCKTCQTPWNRKVNNHCASCNSGYAMIGNHCQADHVVTSGWSAGRDDARVTATCPNGMWVKKCESLEGGGDSDGVLPSDDAKSCTAQASSNGKKVKARAHCSTVKTSIAKTRGAGTPTAKCGYKTLSCTCNTWWHSSSKCKSGRRRNHASTFNPSGKSCSRSVRRRGHSDIYAICKFVGCKTGTGSGCKTCVPAWQRESEAHCASCNAGYTLMGTKCEAIPKCETGSGGKCKTCKAKKDRKVVNHCASCNAGYELKDKTCKAVACPGNSVGKNVPSGCTCNAGYSGTISATSSSPFYSGTCNAVACPAGSSGTDVPSGCTCNKGHQGTVSAKTGSPFYTGSCKVVACPANSAGKNVPSGCSCDAGYSGTIRATSSSPFYSGSCSAVSCPYASSGSKVPSGCSCFNGYEGSVEAKTGTPFYKYSCKSVLIGATIALHGTTHNRFVRMNGDNMDRTGARSSDKLPDDKSFFKVVDAGRGRIGLYNARAQRYVRMRDNQDMDAHTVRKSWESFSVVDAGKGEIALHSERWNRFIRMRDSANMDASATKKPKDLPTGWTWERFKVVQVLLKPGSEIALHNSIHNRFMRMHGDANKMDSSAVKDINKLPDGWTWERFKVVDAGFGQVALHSRIHNRFVRMWDSDMDRSSRKNAGDLPKGWWAERFTVVDCGGGKVAFHSARFNRFIRMNHADMDRSGVKDADELPSGWTWECFKPIEAFTCKTGSGSSCKSCVAPGSRTATDHCSSCNAGFALVGRVCKSEHAVTSAQSQLGDDKIATATCPAGMWVKKCQVVKVGSGNLADGAVVDDGATKCTAQSTAHMRVKAKAFCSTTKTYAVSTKPWQKGTKTASCAKPLSCNCRSAWKVKDQCWSGRQTAATFDPSTTNCKRKSGNSGIQVTAVCEVLSCAVGGAAGCKTCAAEREREIVNHCASCNPGYYLDKGICKAYTCKKSAGSGCGGCRPQHERTANNQCNGCNAGWALVGTQCKDDHTVVSGFSGNNDDDTTQVACPTGMWARECEVVEVQGAGRRRRRRRGQDNKKGDGLDVPNPNTCKAITTTGVKLKAKAHCSTTETAVADSGKNWKKGWVEVGCTKGDAVSCTCWSAWRVNDYCKAGPNKGWAATFKPIRGKCKRFSPGGRGRIQVHALCSMERCSKFGSCPDGYSAKPATTIGSSVEACCTPVACPAGSTGTDVPSGCTCAAGYTGSITKSGASPFYTGSCAAVDCPENSDGSNVPSGCTCKTGYSGKITAIASSPFYKGACAETCALYSCPKGYKPKASTTKANSLSGCCEPVDCPAGSSGDAVHSGCSCDAGHSGSISATTSAPYYSGACATVACPDNSEGAHVPAGCKCNAGYSGTIEASKASPFYTGSCAAVACPADSSGTDVPSGCSCNAGFSGKITASDASPFYKGKCAVVDCPTHSSGSNVPAGCACDAGYSGSITAAAAHPFYNGKCEAVACPKYSTGTNVPGGCKCKNGYKGKITASTASPFYTGKCTPVGCPDNTEGNNVPGGCDCLAGFSGEIAGDDERPWYTGTCAAEACPAGSSGTDIPSGCTCKAGFSGSVTATKTSPYYSGGCSAVSCPANSQGTNVPAGCTCNTGYTGTIAATSSSPFYSGSCVATCSLYSCPKGYKPKPGTTVGETLAACCDAVACPANSLGTDVPSGCSCKGGYTGTITATKKAPFYSGSCEAVACPARSTGASIPEGCACKAGYSGTISPATSSPFYAGQCQHVNCPAKSSGNNVVKGCACDAGYEGEVKATTTAPFFESTCKAVDCPAHSTGKDVVSGCTCDAGYTGTITASSTAPFYTGSCTAVACPANSKGTSVPAGCVCDAGYSGSITASSSTPFYTGSCDPVACPAHSTGTNIPAGCVCNAGYEGAITAAKHKPYHKGKCSAAACPAHSSGTNIVKGCTCNAGYDGDVVAKVGAPFFSGGCKEWGCNTGTGASCKTCVELSKRTQENHCASCNAGYTILEPQCKVMASDQKCGGPTCAKACKGDKCGFKCAGRLFGQEECAAQCEGEQCGFQCSGGNCASTCQGKQCAYECQSSTSAVQQCGMACKGFECGYYCQGAECARSCDGDRCGAYCSGEKGEKGHCAAKCVGRQCGFECIGHQCAAECKGSRCAYRCQGDYEDKGSCGLQCEGLECAYRCQGSSCAQLCTGDRCGYSCQSGSGSDQSCAKQCKGEECGAKCSGATCAKGCEGTKCAFQCSGKLQDVETCGIGCKGESCAEACTGSECAKGCEGDRCGAGCSGTLGSKSHCAAGCVGRRCAANCKGAYCGAGCKGEGCAMGCEGENCDQGCTGANCGKGASSTSTCKEELDKDPNLCGLRATFNDEVIFAGEKAADVCCSKTDCPEGYELVNGECTPPGCRGELVDGCYLADYSKCSNTYIKYETEYIQCGAAGPNCLSDHICKK